MPAAIPLHPAEPRHEQRIALAELARTGEPWCRPARPVEQHLHRRATKSRSISTESSGSIVNTSDPRSCSQGRWLVEVPPAGGVISTTSRPCWCRSIPAPAASCGSCKVAWMKRFSSPCPRRSWSAGEREAAARHRRVAMAPAGGPEALARAAQCPGRRR